MVEKEVKKEKGKKKEEEKGGIGLVIHCGTQRVGKIHL